MIRLSDYVIGRLVDWGVRHIFMVTGGGSMHLNDSIGKESRIRYICHHHEQAATMAAEGYARTTGTTGVVNVTTGPGGLNSLNGVFGAWTDSIPLLIISGQVKRETCAALSGPPNLRQLGDQEVDIVSIVKPITKYAVLVSEPTSIRYQLERAWHLAASGRPGPCWIDIPVDVQGSLIDENALVPFNSAEDHRESDEARLPQICQEIVERLRQAVRPVIMAGSGVRIAGAIPEFERVIRSLRIPVTTAWTHDLIPSDDDLFCGRPGTIGERAGNFTVQNADVLLVLGSRLNIRQVSYNWASFAPHAFKIQVDIDPAELRKPTVKPDLPVVSHLKPFLSEVARHLQDAQWNPDAHSSWLAWCRQLRARYPVVQEKQRTSGPYVNPYFFVERLFASLADDDIVVCGNSTACIVPYQVGYLKRGQRMFSNSGAASMGHDLPAAIGTAIARGGKRVVCLAGDGSIQFNLQELQTIANHQLPIKIFVLNNRGYLSIRTTQSGFFGRLVGEGPTSGVTFPDIVRVASAYGIPSSRIDHTDCLASIPSLLAEAGPSLCEVMLDPDQEFEPRVRSRRLPDGTMISPALEDMYPFLDREELRANLFVKETI